MNNFLSIGELAKLRNVNVQSLRYYEKLGVLVPAYINPESGYRYYSLEQIMILDTIILCIDLGIPLKDLKNYVNADGELEFEYLLKDGKKLAKEKIRKIESSIDSINRTLQHINAQKTKNKICRLLFLMALFPLTMMDNLQSQICSWKFCQLTLLLYRN